MKQKFYLPASLVAGIIIILLLLIHAYSFINSNINTYIKNDGYYWVEYVIKPFIKNGFSWDQIFYTRDRGDHIQPLTKALYLLNAHKFKLDLKLFGIIGYFSLLMSILLMVYHYARQNLSNYRLPFNRNLLITILFILFYFIFFNFNVTKQYGYELILVNTLYSMLIPIAFIISFDRYLTGHKIHLTWIVTAAFIVAIVGSTNLLYLVAALGTSTIIFLLRFNDNAIKKRAINLMISLIIIILAQKVFFAQFSKVAPSFHNVVPSIDKSYTFFLKAAFLALGVTVISPKHSNYLLNLKDDIYFTLVVVGIFFLFLIIGTYYLYLKNKQYNDSTIPLFMLIMYGMTITGIIIIRGPTFGETCTLYPRYIKSYNLIYIGLIWIFTYLIINNSNKKQIIGSIIFIISFLSVNLYSLSTAMNHSKYTIRTNNIVKRRLLQALNKEPEKISNIPPGVRAIGWNNDRVFQVQKYLKDHNLTFFAYKKEDK